ncbi:MAG: magnesium chelatase, partial [Flavisolibacter sp.]|nr:magnesium chelatase [Flavisolibacter sp.]
MDIKRINTIQELKEAGYKPKSIKEEIRQNLIKKLQAKEDTFRGIIGYEETVIPDVERALLSKHNILFLGLRGQAKTRMARQMTELLDEYIPVVAGSDINDDPLRPISKYA